MVNKEIILKARTTLAEFGFEQTPDQLQKNDSAMSALDMWAENVDFIEFVAEQLDQLIAIGKITNFSSLRRELGKILDTKLSNKDVGAWISLIKIFVI